MSVQTLYTAATGMQALETKLEVIANNLANVNTTGFKRGRANFEDLFYRQEVLPGAETAGQITATGTAIGLGSRVSSVQSNFTQGAFNMTGGQLDLTIVGDGFFRVTDPASGEILYTRAGNFEKNAQGNLVLGSASIGRLLDPGVSIPDDAVDIVISGEGVVSYRQFGTPNLQQAGQIELANFINPGGLLHLGDNLYAETDASGSATSSQPGTNGLGTVQQGALEMSNVEPVQELIDLITTQRAFELNSQAVKAGDEVLQVITNLRR